MRLLNLLPFARRRPARARHRAMPLAALVPVELDYDPVLARFENECR